MTPLLFLNMLLRYRWCAASSVVAVNDRSSAGIDRCGWLSLQEANNKGEVKKKNLAIQASSTPACTYSGSCTG